MQEQEIELLIPKNTVVNLLVYRLMMPIIISVVTSVAKVILSCTCRGTKFEAIALAVEKFWALEY